MVDERAQKPIDEVYQDIFWAMMANVHTISIGQVVSFDEESQTIEYQPVLMRKFINDDSAKPLPPKSRVPVVFPGDGDFFVTFKPKTGSYCVVLYGMRSIDNWFEQGGVVDPNSYRRFDISDAIAICGINPKPSFLSAVNEGIALRNRDMTTMVNVTENQVDVKSNAKIVVDGGSDIELKNSSGSATLKSDGSFDVNGHMTVLP